MEKKLKKMFDYQRFEKNERLEKMIKETESRYGGELSDDDLARVSAAGTPEAGGSYLPNGEGVGGLSGDSNGDGTKRGSVFGYNTGNVIGGHPDDLVGFGSDGGGGGAGGKGTTM